MIQIIRIGIFKQLTPLGSGGGRLPARMLTGTAGNSSSAEGGIALGAQRHEGRLVDAVVDVDVTGPLLGYRALPGILAALANVRRLTILCRLVEDRETTVGTLADEVGLSQSALSQHLARMREEGIVAFRRDAQTLWYRIADSRVESLLATLHRLYCRD